MLGDRPSYIYQNDWLDYTTIMEPTCAFNRLTRRKSLLIIVKSAPHRLQVCYLSYKAFNYNHLLE